ncbi:hypothetical protein BJY24_004947 [Nocardia transvalensis]|uniref:Uncharacterized protein n=1 Tax=Nocardia transvalensis TaxID=37333 RepID=A0A7W9UKW2_9NOCA|nr:hypothetical protein [Nocardia transvalensis]
MNVVTKLAATVGVLLAVPWIGAGLASATPILVTDAPAALRSTAAGADHPSAITGRISSGSVDSEPGFDPGPYPSWDACEQARARYYDPSRLECVPA